MPSHSKLHDALLGIAGNRGVPAQGRGATARRRWNIGGWLLLAVLAACQAAPMQAEAPGAAIPNTAFPLLPGDTMTNSDATLRIDAVQFIRTVSAVHYRHWPMNCSETPEVTKTVVLSVDKEAQPTFRAGTSPYAWTEAWTLSACGSEATWELRFVPYGTGTLIKTTARQ